METTRVRRNIYSSIFVRYRSLVVARRKIRPSRNYEQRRSRRHVVHASTALINSTSDKTLVIASIPPNADTPTTYNECVVESSKNPINCTGAGYGRRNSIFRRVSSAIYCRLPFYSRNLLSRLFYIFLFYPKSPPVIPNSLSPVFLSRRTILCEREENIAAKVYSICIDRTISRYNMILRRMMKFRRKKTACVREYLSLSLLSFYFLLILCIIFFITIYISFFTKYHCILIAASSKLAVVLHLIPSYFIFFPNLSLFLHYNFIFFYSYYNVSFTICITFLGRLILEYIINSFIHLSLSLSVCLFLSLWPLHISRTTGTSRCFHRRKIDCELI